MILFILLLFVFSLGISILISVKKLKKELKNPVIFKLIFIFSLLLFLLPIFNLGSLLTENTTRYIKTDNSGQVIKMVKIESGFPFKFMTDNMQEGDSAGDLKIDFRYFALNQVVYAIISVTGGVAFIKIMQRSERKL